MRHYFFRGKHIASVNPSAIFVHGRKQIPPGRAFFCPICAEIWLLAPVDREETFVDHVLCDRHPPTASRRAGSMFLSWDAEWNKDLPSELLKMEFLTLYSQKEMQNGNS